MIKMSLRAHLTELQRCLKYSLIFWGVGFAIALWWRRVLLEMVQYPHTWAMKKLNLASTVYVFRYQDNFISQLKICALAGFILSFPFILHQGLKFISPGLHDHEKKTFLSIYLPAFVLLFLSGAVFSYFFLIPYGLYFLILFGTQVNLFPLISFVDYISLFLMMILVSALTFQLPLLMIALTRLGIVSLETFQKNRKIYILIAFISAAILTPPDPVTQLILVVPLILLYEIGIICMQFRLTAKCK